MDTGLGVKGLIIKKKEILVLVKSDGKADLPGGRVESVESPTQTLYREIAEETGLTVTIENLVTKWAFINKVDLVITGFTYSCQYQNGKVRLSPEHVSYFWAPFNSLDHLDLKLWISMDR